MEGDLKLRLWHVDLLKQLPRQQLLGQWRECIALLGNGWGKKHSIVNYVFEYPEYYLVNFAQLVADEMVNRSYKPKRELIINALSKRHNQETVNKILVDSLIYSRSGYNEHNVSYRYECIKNLNQKGIKIVA